MFLSEGQPSQYLSFSILMNSKPSHFVLLSSYQLSTKLPLSINKVYLEKKENLNESFIVDHSFFPEVQLSCHTERIYDSS